MAKGQAIFNTEAVITVDRARIDDLKRRAAATENHNFRLCLHHGPEDILHEMVIVHGPATYVQPHKHEHVDKSVHVLEGGVLVVLFDDEGNATDRFDMGDLASGRPFICRIGRGLWHTEIVRVDPTVFIENTQGPFLRERHNTFAPWAPAPDDPPAIAAWTKSLLE